jgi:hypothetical protein
MHSVPDFLQSLAVYRAAGITTVVFQKLKQR